MKCLYSTQFGDKINNGGAFMTSFFSWLIAVSCSSPMKDNLRNLGLMFDNNFNFREHISHI